MINIDGVEVLNSCPIYSLPAWAIATMIALIAIAVIWLVIVVNGNLGIWADIILLVLFLACAVFWMCGIIGVLDCETGLNTYECTIDDSVSLNEIYESYEVVSKDGKIWTLRDLED